MESSILSVVKELASDACNKSLVETNTCDRICRTCLTEHGEMRSLFEDTLNDMLMSFTNVQVSTDDGLPRQICTQCVLHISRAYHFKQQAETSDVTLRQYYSTPTVLDISQFVPEPTDNLMAPNTNSDYFVIEQSNIKNELKEETEVFDDKNMFCGNVDSMENLLMGENLCEEDLEFQQIDKQDMICKVCSMVCKSDEDLKLHAKKHTSPKEHKCEECGKSFHYKVGLRTHMRTHGVGEKKHQCTECGKQFYEQGDMIIHMRGHTGEKPVICDSCGKSFADPRTLAKHLKIHSGEKKYECDICNKRFIHSYTLTAHKRTHTGEKPFVCSTCGHACTTSTQLKLHTRRHTQEKPYECGTCAKAFTSHSGLSNHLMTHTGQRRYICAICGKGARTSTDLASHLRTHTGEKPFLCKMKECPKRYKTHSQLSAHMRTHTENAYLMQSDDEDDNQDISLAMIIEDFRQLMNEDFKIHFRLSKCSVEMLILEIGSAVIPRNPRRPAVHVNTAILLFLWTLTHEESFRKVAKRFEIGQGHAHRIFITMCTALAAKREQFIYWPNHENIGKTIDEFRTLGTGGNFPDLIGSVDYIHIPIPGPSNDTTYFNRFGFCSLILQGVCNAKMEFMNVSVECPGNVVNPWSKTQICKDLTNKIIAMPDNTYLIAGRNYEASEYLLTPSLEAKIMFADNENVFNETYNEKFTIENAFMVLKTYFTRINYVKVQKIDYARSIIIATCILHNICLREDDDLSMEDVTYLINDDSTFGVVEHDHPYVN